MSNVKFEFYSMTIDPDTGVTLGWRDAHSVTSEEEMNRLNEIMGHEFYRIKKG